MANFHRDQRLHVRPFIRTSLACMPKAQCIRLLSAGKGASSCWRQQEGMQIPCSRHIDSIMLSVTKNNVSG